jgi:hypothetical protein
VQLLRPPSAAASPAAGQQQVPPGRSSGSLASAPQLQTLSCAALADEPGARPWHLVPPEAAAGCNVVELQELVLRAVPAAYKAAAAAAQGRLSLTAGGRGPRSPAARQCPGRAARCRSPVLPVPHHCRPL